MAPICHGEDVKARSRAENEHPRQKNSCRHMSSTKYALYIASTITNSLALVDLSISFTTMYVVVCSRGRKHLWLQTFTGADLS